MTKKQLKFCNDYGSKDSTDMDESIVELLMDDHFYVIYKKSGYFIPEEISMLSKEDSIIHNELYNLKE